MEVAIAEPLAHSGETVVSPSVQEVLASKGALEHIWFAWAQILRLRLRLGLSPLYKQTQQRF